MTAQTMSFRYELACKGHSTEKAHDLCDSLVVLEAWPWPRGSPRTLHEGLAVSVGLDVGLKIMWPCLGLENFLCPWPWP